MWKCGSTFRLIQSIASKHLTFAQSSYLLYQYSRPMSKITGRAKSQKHFCRLISFSSKCHEKWKYKNIWTLPDIKLSSAHKYWIRLTPTTLRCHFCYLLSVKFKKTVLKNSGWGHFELRNKCYSAVILLFEFKKKIFIVISPGGADRSQHLWLHPPMWPWRDQRKPQPEDSRSAHDLLIMDAFFVQ